MATAYYYFLLTLSLLTFYGAAAYRFYQLNYAGVWLTIALTAFTFIVLKKAAFGKQQNFADHTPKEIERPTQAAANVKYSIFNIACLALLAVNFIIIFGHSTADAIVSPWQIVPWYFWLTFTLGIILLVAIILKNSAPNFIYRLLVAGYWLLVLSVGLIIYQIGFGFDPFIHQATEKLISATGAVYPKPWYYLGQYALIVILNKLTFIPVVWLDKLLVPVLAALTLPYALYQAAKFLTADERVAKLTALFALIFPFATFTLTTPQNLAIIFLLLIILLSVKIWRQNKLFVAHCSLLITLSLASLLTHPIAGLPAVLFVALIISRQIIHNKKLLFTSSFLLLTLSVISLPLAFYLNNQTNLIINAGNDAAAAVSWNWPQLFFSGTANFLLNFIYLYGFNIGVIIITFIIAGVIIHYQIVKRITRYSPACRRGRLLVTNYSPYLLMSFSLLISYFITKTISFSYLIDYERSSFAGRILIIAAYFALPFIVIALTKLMEMILPQERMVKYLFFCFLAFLISCSLYFSYPRSDDYYNSRSFSTSQSDINAARWINQDAGGSDYIVLANQQVSAAALREFGFKKYYKIPSPYQGGGESEVFYYPIPTGEKLYQYYLDMVNKNAGRQTALAAADLVGADTAYFVINHYWFAFDKILAEAAIGAAAVENIDQGKIFVFKYANPVKK